MNENNPIISSVITKLHKQQEKGLKKYGVEVDTSSHDLKGWLQHGLEETLDLATYLETAIQLLEEQVKRKKEEMKFYEVHDPYYALIKANTKESAIKLYLDEVAADEGDLYMKEVSAINAAVTYGVLLAETDDAEITKVEMIENLEDEEERVLLMDGGLL